MKFNKLIYYILIVSFIGCKSYKSVSIRDGILVLPEDINDRVISLKGEWEIYWNVLNEWDKIDTQTDKVIIDVPSSWNKYNPGEDKSSGYATYRLKILNLKLGERYYFRVKNQTTAYSFYVNRELLAQSGVVGRKETEMIPQYRVNYVNFLATNDSAEVLLTVSNFHHSRGGYRYPIEFGNKWAIVDTSLYQAGFEFIVMGSILAMGLFHMIQFMIQRNQFHLLYFSVFCFINALRLFVLDNFYITFFFPDISWYFLAKMDYATTPLVAPLFLEYLRYSYPEDVKKIHSTIVFYASLFVTLLVMTTPPMFFTSILFLNNTVVGASILIALYAVLKINHYRRMDSRYLLLGTTILMGFGIHDLLSGSRIIETDLRFPIGLFIFFLIQTVILSRKNSYIFNHAQSLKSEYSKVSKKLEHLNRDYSRFVPREFLNFINRSNIIDVQYGDNTSKKIAILASDIREFTNFSEGMTPEDNFKFLNAYLKRVSPVVTKNNGFIDKYIGDAIIALYPKGSQNAIDSAIEMHMVVNEYNQLRLNRGDNPISIGVGIHQGDTLLGILGENERMQTSAISESVHLTSVIEGLTKKYGAKILISVDALYASDSFDKYPFRMVDSIKIVPGAEAIGIVEILIEGIDETSNLKIEYKDIFERGVYSFLEGDFQQASDLFEVMIAQIEQDEAAKLYYHRSQKYLKYGAPPGWEKSDSIEI